MSESYRQRVKAVDGTEDIPLPGLIDCLTLQINVTAHHKQQTMKAVAVLRDPNSGYEILRRVVDLDSRQTAGRDVEHMIHLIYGDLLSLMAWGNPTW